MVVSSDDSGDDEDFRPRVAASVPESSDNGRSKSSEARMGAGRAASGRTYQTAVRNSDATLCTLCELDTHHADMVRLFRARPTPCSD